VILGLLEKYGQGGNCGFYAPGFYHNAFLITDTENAWVLETAGEYWAAEKVKGIRTISNTMTVHQYDRIHEGTIANAVAKGYCKSEADFDFTEAYLDKTEKWTGSGIDRQCKTNAVLNADAGKVDTETMLRALRSHNVENYWENSFASPCMHAGANGDAHSSASMIAITRPDGKSTYWGTNMSIPCIAPYKPFWFDAFADDLVFPYDKQEEAMDAWLYREDINRAFVDGRIDEETYKKELYAMENDWIVRCAAVEDKDAATRKVFAEAVSKEEKAFIDKWTAIAKQAASAPKGDAAYQDVWKEWNERKGRDGRIAY
ncbi:MAG: hypothetical protein RR614_01995, partial [Eubacterium sp.]